MAGALAYMDDYRFEMIHGKEIIMSPVRFKHYIVQENLKDILKAYIKTKPGYIVLSDFAIYFEKNHWMEPDICIISDKNMIRDSFVYGAPDFVVEIFSPGTYKRDISVKKDTYEQYGVKEYWTIDPDSRIITVYLNKDGKFTLDDTYYPYTEDDLKAMRETERSELKDEIKLSVFDDLIIKIDDIFKDV